MFCYPECPSLAQPPPCAKEEGLLCAGFARRITPGTGTGAPWGSSGQRALLSRVGSFPRVLCFPQQAGTLRPPFLWPSAGLLVTHSRPSWATEAVPEVAWARSLGLWSLRSLFPQSLCPTCAPHPWPPSVGRSQGTCRGTEDPGAGICSEVLPLAA